MMILKATSLLEGHKDTKVTSRITQTKISCINDKFCIL